VVGVSVAAIAVVALNGPPSQQVASASETLRTAHPAGSSTPGPSPSSSSRSSDSSAGSATASSGSSSPSGDSTASSNGSTGKLPVIVLNNTSATPGSVAANRFRQAGWPVSDVSTFTGDILSTAAYYDPNVAGANSAATELQQEFPAIHRVKPKFDGLPAGPIVVVLTSDYS
jgi:hypothetical protein